MRRGAYIIRCATPHLMSSGAGKAATRTARHIVQAPVLDGLMAERGQEQSIAKARRLLAMSDCAGRIRIVLEADDTVTGIHKQGKFAHWGQQTPTDRPSRVQMKLPSLQGAPGTCSLRR